MTEIRNFKGTVEFSESNRVEKYSPWIDHVTLNFNVSHPKHTYGRNIFEPVKFPECHLHS